MAESRLRSRAERSLWYASGCRNPGVFSLVCRSTSCPVFAPSLAVADAVSSLVPPPPSHFGRCVGL